MTIDWLRTSLTSLTKPDVSAQKLVQERADTILRPAGALRELDDVAVWMSGWQQTTTPRVSRPAALVFAADHGVAVTGGVSAWYDVG